MGQVTVVPLASVEQLLVTYPRGIASGYSGTTPDGYGHVHLGYTNNPAPCTHGYKPKSQWRNPLDLRNAPICLAAKCAAGTRYVQRGSSHAPAPKTRSYRVAPYDARTGSVLGTPDEVVVSGLGASDV